MIDSDGYRANVGIILSNQEGKLLWARRIGQDAWQFPQGGICADESPDEAMFRELREEIGLREDQVELVAKTRDWLRYRLPEKYIRYHCKPLCIGQKQRWYMLRLLVDDHEVCLSATQTPEFDTWRWVNYWHPLREVVFFKRRVYRHALKEFAPHLRMGKPPRVATRL